MNNIEQYRKRFYNLMESTIGNVKPLIKEEETTTGNIKMEKWQMMENIKKFSKMISDDTTFHGSRDSMYSEKLKLEIIFEVKGNNLFITNMKYPITYKIEGNQVYPSKSNSASFDNLYFTMYPTFDDVGAKKVISVIFDEKKVIDQRLESESEKTPDGK